MYIRTQETEVQQREYRDHFESFGAFFGAALEGHEDADILRQMFAPGGLHGHALPIWTVEDLESFTAERFWLPGHSSPFKDAVAELRSKLLSSTQPPPEAPVAGPSGGPPLLAWAALAQHLPRIAKLEAFDPRDHEAAKVSRLRGHLRATYGRVAQGDPARTLTTADLLNIFDPDDRDVRRHGGCILRTVQARFEDQCRLMRLDTTVAAGDPEVAAVFERFRGAAGPFAAAAAAFADEAGPLAEREILRAAASGWRLDPDESAAALADILANAEERFMEASGLSREEMRRLNMHEKVRWRIEDCVMRLRGKVAAEMLLLSGEPSPQGAGGLGAEGADVPEPQKAWVWRLGEWRWAQPSRDGKTQPGRGARPKEFAVWSDGASCVLYEERRLPHLAGGAGAFVGVPRERWGAAVAAEAGAGEGLMLPPPAAALGG